MSTTADILQLIEQEIPECRRHLQDSHANLENVAAYCEDKYIQDAEKRMALEETKNFTTQSLASVAYQINTLATNFLQLLDLQTTQLAEMESSVNNLSQTVMIHKEKVARREIGVLTTNKSTTRPQGVRNGIIFPEQPERPVKYLRKPIDYSVLDEIGHGVKIHSNRAQRTPSTASSRASSASTSSRQAPTTRPPTPPQPTGGGTLTRQVSSPYRTPAPPVSPPSVPTHYAPSNITPLTPVSGQQRNTGHYAQQPRSGYASHREIQYQSGTQQPVQYARGSYAQQVHSHYAARREDYVQQERPSMYAAGSSGGPPMGMVQPMTHHVAAPPTPPPPPLQSQSSISSVDSYEPPPPPMPESYDDPRMMGSVSPPLPPPPETPGGHYDFAPPPSQFMGDIQEYNVEEEYEGPRRISSGYRRDHIPEWAPDNYLEKVVAIYDYQKDKEDELSFSEGSVIYVVRKNDDGWYEGVMEGTTGLFPGNYVEPCMLSLE